MSSHKKRGTKRSNGYPEQTDVSYMEGQIPTLYGSSAVEVPGARSLLEKLIAASSPWTIVTSGTTPLVTGWLKILGLPTPQHLVVAEDVEKGKPDPRCYRMGLEKLGLVGQEADVLVLEDSPAGIRAGRDAGCKVLGVVTSHTVEQVIAAGPDWIVKDLSSVRLVSGDGGKVTLEIRDALVRV